MLFSLCSLDGVARPSYRTFFGPRLQEEKLNIESLVARSNPDLSSNIVPSTVPVSPTGLVPARTFYCNRLN